MARQRWVTWEQYLKLSEEEQRHVSIVTFTGLTDDDTLGVAREGGDDDPPSQTSSKVRP